MGAGAAGLAAAEVLSKNDESVVIVEARDRIGGRILTQHDPTFGMPIELGAEFIHGRPEVTWNLLRHAGMAAQRAEQVHVAARTELREYKTR